MILKTLVENTAVSSEYQSKHGICFYIETGEHKILFDLGPNDLFLKNAEKMGVDISEVDTVVISHGHRDHGGALKLFLEKNQTAKVYIHENAFEKHYVKVLGIYFNTGIDASLKHHPQVILTNEMTPIDHQLLLFADVQERKLRSKSNDSLYAKRNAKICLDDFSHEQNLIVTEDNKRILIAGCSHAGIVNIKRKAEGILNGKLTYVIAGFHLYNPVSGKKESDDLIQAIGEQLNDDKTHYYTCHCTGKKAFAVLKDVLSDKLSYLSTGTVLEL